MAIQTADQWFAAGRWNIEQAIRGVVTSASPLTGASIATELTGTSTDAVSLGGQADRAVAIEGTRKRT